MIYRRPESCASRDRDVYRMHVDFLRSRHVSRHRILIVKPLSHLITSINHRPLFAVVTVLLISACSMVWVIYNDLGNLEAVTFIFSDNKQNVSIHKRFLQTADRISHGHPSSTTLKWGLKLNEEKTPNGMIKHYKLYERSNQKVKHIFPLAIDMQIQILPLTSGASIWPKLDLIDGI